MLKISYKHQIQDDGSVLLADYRCEDVTFDGKVLEIVCELDGGKLCWFTNPDDFSRAVIEGEFERVQREWFHKYFGLKPVFGAVPDVSIEELMEEEWGIGSDI